MKVPPYMVDGPETRKDLAAYYNEVSRTDTFLGKLMAELERQGISENTYLIYCSDNGRPFPHLAALSVESDATRYPAAKEYWKHQREGTLLPQQMDVQLVPRPSVELYRTDKDSDQLTNLAGQPEVKETQEKLEKILAQWSEETGDTVPKNPTPTRTKEDAQAGVRGEIPGAAKQAERINHSGPILLNPTEKF